MTNYLTNGSADWINVETVVSTSSDQIAVAPGSLIKQWKEEDRSYFQYQLDHLSQDFYSIVSARYEVARRKWNGIEMEVYHHKDHSTNVEMMLNAIERSLKYYTKNFGPYYHKQARIIEFPRYSTFAQAFPGTMPYSEAFGFVINLEDEEDNNIIDAVIAHEMAHQWWAHQLIGADMQGATMLSESFSEYASLMVMKNALEDKSKMKDFLKYNFDRYLSGRSGETKKETPLYKVENKSYIHYGKGSLVMYALQEYVGEDSVNAALRAFLEEFRYSEPPYPTSLDFLRHLEAKVPDSLAYLVDDGFKKITLYDLRLEEANYGNDTVSLTLIAKKFYADSLGNEHKTAINDWVDIGIYADKDKENLILKERIKINQDSMYLSFKVDTTAQKVVIDPDRLLIERVVTDNSKSME